MTLYLNDEVIHQAGLDDRELKIELALALYQHKKLSIGQASKLAEMPLLAFQFELGERNIPVTYDVEALQEDLKTWQNLSKN